MALVPLTTGGPLVLLAAVEAPLPPLVDEVGRAEEAEGGAGVIFVLFEVVVLGVGGFSTKEVSVVLESQDCQR